MPRPKSREAYEVLSCRVPQGLPARLSDHARLHRQRVRDVIVEALQAYLDKTEVLPLEAAADALVRAALGHITEAARVLGRVPSARRAPAGPPAVSVTPQPDPDGTPAYDTTKFYLGRLCPKAHRWGNTDMTLKTNKGNKCPVCENEAKKARRLAKRQALEAPAA